MTLSLRLPVNQRFDDVDAYTADLARMAPGGVRQVAPMGDGAFHQQRVTISLPSLYLTAYDTSHHRVGFVNDSVIGLHFIRNGTMELVDRQGDACFGTATTMAVPKGQYRRTLSDGFEAECLGLHKTLFDDACRILGHAHVNFDRVLHHRIGTAASGTAGFVRDVLAGVPQNGMLLSNARWLAALQEMVALRLANDVLAWCQIPEPKSVPLAATTRAMDYIQAHCTRPISLFDLSEHAGSSLRDLQRKFPARFGMTITEAIRRSRLTAVHERLTQPGAGSSVTEIALACGFTHLGSFSRHYRDAFGEAPFETLRRYREA